MWSIRMVHSNDVTQTVIVGNVFHVGPNSFFFQVHELASHPVWNIGIFLIAYTKPLKNH